MREVLLLRFIFVQKKKNMTLYFEKLPETLYNDKNDCYLSADTECVKNSRRSYEK